jgi:hypothetical protein
MLDKRACGILGALAILVAGAPWAFGGQTAAAGGGVLSGVITAQDDNWVEVQAAGQQSQRFGLPAAASVAKPAATKVTRLEAAFHASVGNEVDLLWQTVDGKPTAVGMIVKAGSPATAVEHPAVVADKGGLVYAEPAKPSGQGEEVAAGAGSAGGTPVGQQPAEVLVAAPWPSGAQENPDPFEANYGSMIGFVTGKGGTEFIDVKPVGDDSTPSARFMPVQAGPATATDNGLDPRVQEAIRLIPVGTRVQVMWIYDDGKRAVRIIPATQNGVIIVE